MLVLWMEYGVKYLKFTECCPSNSIMMGVVKIHLVLRHVYKTNKKQHCVYHWNYLREAIKKLGCSFSSCPLDRIRFANLFKSKENAKMQKFAASSIYFQKSKKNSPNKTIIAFYFDSCCQKVLDSIYQGILFLVPNM